MDLRLMKKWLLSLTHTFPSLHYWWNRLSILQKLMCWCQKRPTMTWVNGIYQAPEKFFADSYVFFFHIYLFIYSNPPCAAKIRIIFQRSAHTPLKERYRLRFRIMMSHRPQRGVELSNCQAIQCGRSAFITTQCGGRTFSKQIIWFDPHWGRM